MKSLHKKLVIAGALSTMLALTGQNGVSYAETNVGFGVGIHQFLGFKGSAGAPPSLPGAGVTAESEARKAGALAIVKSDQGYGVLSLDGSESIEATHKSVDLYGGRYFNVKDKGQKEGTIVDVHGQDAGATLATENAQALATFLEDPTIDTNSDYYEAFYDKDKKRYGFRNIKGKEVLPPVYKEVLAVFSEGRAFVKTEDGDKVAIDATGKMLFSVKDYDSVSTYRNGLAEVQRRVHRFGVGVGFGILLGDKHRFKHRDLFYEDYYDEGAIFTSYDGIKRGYIDLDGKVVVDSKLDKVYPMSTSGVVVEDKGKLAFLNRKGEAVIPYGDYEPSGMDEDAGYLGLKDKKTSKYGILSTFTGEEILPFNYDGISFTSHDIVVADKDKGQQFLQILAPREPKVLFTISEDADYSPFDDAGVMWVREDTFLKKKVDGVIQPAYIGYKIVDISGQVLFEAKDVKIQKVTPFEFGLSTVKVDGKWGIMKADGTWLVEPKYKEITML